MRIIASTASVVGDTDSSVWAQTLSLAGVYAAIEVEDSESLARNHGMHVLSALSERLSAHPKSLEDIRKIAAYGASQGTTGTIILVPERNILRIVIDGIGAVYLKRENKLATLLKGSGNIQGEVQVGDTILIVTSRLMDVLPESELAGVFDHLSAPDVAEKLMLLLHQTSQILGGAALIYQVTEFAEDELLENEPPLFTPVSKSLSRLGAHKRFMRVIKKVRERRFGYIQEVFRRFSSPKQRRLMITGIFLLIIISIFVGVVVVGIRRQRVQKVYTAADIAIEKTQHLLEEGMALRDLNPIKGRERLTEAKNTLESYSKTVSNTSPTGKKIQELYKQVTDNLTLAMQIYQVKPQEYFNATLLKAGASVQKMSYSGGILGLLDGKGKTVFVLKLPSKSGMIAGGGNSLGTDVLIAAGSDSLYVLDSKTILSLASDGSGTKKTFIKRDSEWGDIVKMSWYSGNIYLLDSAKSRIWKYVTSEKGVPVQREYINPDISPDFSGANDMDIDGFVWITTAGGRILKFAGGRGVDFSPQGIEPGLGHDLQFFTDDTIDHLYILDRSGQRVVRLTKDGVYVAQYIYPKELVPTDVFVSETMKKIFLLSSGQILAFDIQ